MNFLKRDLHYDAKINRKKLVEADRKKRIFDPKTRMFGVDKAALQQQVLERKRAEEQNQSELQQYYRQKQDEDRILKERMKVEDKARKEIEKQMVEYRDLHQKPTSRREYDINDPEAMKREKYADVCSIRFDGEDTAFRKRMEQQKQENRAWLQLQMMEKKKVLNQNEVDHEKAVKDQIARDQRAYEISKLEEECKRKLQIAIAQYNKSIADDRADKERERARLEARQESKEIENWMVGDWLTENPQASRSALGPGRVVPYMYKGQGHSEHINTRQEQLQQAHLNKIARNLEAEKKKQWEEYEKGISQKVAANTDRCIKEQKEFDRRLVDTNNQLAEKHRQREAENNDISQLKPSPEFFDQFNRTTY